MIQRLDKRKMTRFEAQIRTSSQMGPMPKMKINIVAQTKLGVYTTSFRNFYLKFYLGDSNLQQEIRILFIWDSNPSLEYWIFSTLSVSFALRVRFIFETLSNLIRNNNTSVLVLSNSYKGSTERIQIQME